MYKNIQQCNNATSKLYVKDTMFENDHSVIRTVGLRMINLFWQMQFCFLWQREASCKAEIEKRTNFKIRHCHFIIWHWILLFWISKSAVFEMVPAWTWLLLHWDLHGVQSIQDRCVESSALFPGKVGIVSFSCNDIVNMNT